MRPDRQHDRRPRIERLNAAFPSVVVRSLATLGVDLIAALFGLLLRAWADPTPTRDAMTMLLVFGGLIGIGSQLLNIGVGDAARPLSARRSIGLTAIDRRLSEV